MLADGDPRWKLRKYLTQRILRDMRLDGMRSTQPKPPQLASLFELRFLLTHHLHAIVLAGANSAKDILPG